LYKLKFDSYVAFIVVATINAIGLIARAIELRYAVGFPVRRFVVEVLFRIILVTITSVVFSACIYILLSMKNMSIWYLAGTVFLTIISNVVAIWLIGLDFQEKRIVILKLYDLKIKIIKILKCKH
jgi:hypothetical protein